MDYSKINLAKEAFSNGAYSAAYEIFVSLIHSGEKDSTLFLYRALAEIGKTPLEKINVSQITANLTFAYQTLCNSTADAETLISLLSQCLSDCLLLHKSINREFKELDEQLRNQYQGSSGVSFESDDPIQREREHAESQRIQANNNQINQKRSRLENQYKELIDQIISHALKNIAQAPQITHNEYLVPLGLLSEMDSAKALTSESTQTLVENFILSVKNERNSHYWSQNRQQYDALRAEASSLEKTIALILTTEIDKAKQEISTAEAIIKDSKRERKRYALLNFSDRRPLGEKISTSKKTIKAETQNLKQLEAGVCEKCETYRQRLNQVNLELQKQR